MGFRDALLANAALCLLPRQAPAQHDTASPGHSRHVPARDTALVSPCGAAAGTRAGARRGGRRIGTSSHPEGHQQGPGNAPTPGMRSRAGASELFEAPSKCSLLQRAPNAWKGAGEVSRRRLALPNGGKRAVHAPAAFHPACGFSSHAGPSSVQGISSRREREPALSSCPDTANWAAEQPVGGPTAVTAGRS